MPRKASNPILNETPGMRTVSHALGHLPEWPIQGVLFSVCPVRDDVMRRCLRGRGRRGPAQQSRGR
jgi:hypothetical protein